MGRAEQSGGRATVECPADHRCTGGFTTFSTFSLDPVLLSEEGAWQTVLGYVVMSPVSCVVDAGMGVGLIRTLG